MTSTFSITMLLTSHGCERLKLTPVASCLIPCRTYLYIIRGKLTRMRENHFNQVIIMQKCVVDITVHVLLYYQINKYVVTYSEIHVHINTHQCTYITVGTRSHALVNLNCRSVPGQSSGHLRANWSKTRSRRSPQPLEISISHEFWWLITPFRVS